MKNNKKQNLSDKFQKVNLTKKQQKAIKGGSDTIGIEDIVIN
jgi:hypothetical protein